MLGSCERGIAGGANCWPPLRTTRACGIWSKLSMAILRSMSGGETFGLDELFTGVSSVTDATRPCRSVQGFPLVLPRRHRVEWAVASVGGGVPAARAADVVGQDARRARCLVGDDR